MHTLYALFGAPEDVAADHTLTRAAHTLMASWLRCAEAMLRRLLLIEASAFPKPNTRPLLHEKRKRTRREMSFTAGNPEAWRVSFRCFASMQRQRPRRRKPAPAVRKIQLDRRDRWHQDRWTRPTFASAWPLAERYEAILRVFNNPEPYARRLARRLHATPHRIREALRAPPEAEHRVDMFDQMREQVLSAATFANTS